MRLLVTGAGGQLGADLVHVARGHDVVGPTRAELDVTDPAAVEKAVKEVRPDAVLNADGAESIASTSAILRVRVSGDCGFKAKAIRNTVHPMRWVE